MAAGPAVSQRPLRLKSTSYASGRVEIWVGSSAAMVEVGSSAPMKSSCVANPVQTVTEVPDPKAAEPTSLQAGPVGALGGWPAPRALPPLAHWSRVATAAWSWRSSR